jgi:hypothetical protein
MTYVGGGRDWSRPYASVLSIKALVVEIAEPHGSAADGEMASAVFVNA